MSMLNKKTIEDINVNGKKVLVRCDFNVPLKDGVITDENRLNGALPTIKYLIENGAKVILCSHLGKPKGEAKPELSLAPVAKRLSEMLNKEVVFAADDNVVGENAKAAIEKMENGQETDRAQNYNIVTFGINDKSDFMPYDITFSDNGSRYKINVDGKEYNVNISVGGEHFVLNSLCAIAVGRLLNIDMEDILA